ncbi:MAG TPA: nucleotide pyrophosphatase/phosphodiesterase family protein [Beijerinckiaceae bacterium]|jgi:predicted AlkP superfamily pyrophosphatase or phosphodiesterase|nr:nucleotide pyrophosphatase/phosphodiesterase family protein [Beijerinckiaceae bacterium]
MHRTLVLLAVGLTPRHLGPHTPNLARLAAAGGMRPLDTIAPAVTCSVQATFMTGLAPREHGIVGNGWLFRDLMEIWFWRQSNQLVGGEKIWEAGKARDPSFTCANLFWWYNMAASFEIGATPRPIYKADGRKLPDCYTKPASLRDELSAKLGPFPLFQFWGPGTTIASTRWIAEAAKHVIAAHRPTLTLVYLPHLDYDLQRHGPDERHPAVAQSLHDLDAVAGDLVGAAARQGLNVVVLSEYGITPVDAPVHPNRALREAGFLAVREEDGAEMLDPVASRAFAVCDHQIAHVYVAEPSLADPVAKVLRDLDGVDQVLDGAGKRAHALDHLRSGELVALAKPNAWFSYYYWLDDGGAPDFARTVEIHRKPGYDPVELFLDPAIRFPKLALGARLAKRRLGLRTLMDVIPLNASLVKGSHGRITSRSEDGPLVISSKPALLPDGPVAATQVKQLILDHVFGAFASPEGRGRVAP